MKIIDAESLSDLNVFSSRELQHEDLIGYSSKNFPTGGVFLEFGVFEGKSTNAIAMLAPGNRLYAFDSFRWLPETWYTGTNKYSTHFFSTMLRDTYYNGMIKTKVADIPYAKPNLPLVPNNVTLIEGWFQDTLPLWKSMFDSIQYMHIDSDIYASCKYILNTLNDSIKNGTVIVFDDFCSFEDDSEYNLWKHGEFKAVQEWLLETNRDIKFLSRTKVGAVGIEVIK